MTRLEISPTIVSRFANLICAASLAIGMIVSQVSADEDETRLTQPVLEPIPDEIEREPEKADRAVETPEDRATIFGATMLRGRGSRAIITDVAIGSPAARAGLREGDEILSVAGFRGDSYEEWLDGVRRIVRDTPDGETVPIVIERNGKRATVPVRTLVASPAEGSLATGRPVYNVQDVGPSIATRPGRPGIGIGGSDDDIFLNNGAFFGDDALAGDPSQRAIAHLYMVPAAERPQRTPAVDVDGAGTQIRQPTNQNRPALDPGTAIEASAGDVRESSAGGFGQGRGVAGARIGLAGFRDREQGMLVMVDVGSLPAGNYLVAIADPNAFGGAINLPAVNPSENVLPGQRRTNQTAAPNQATPERSRLEQNVEPSQRRQPSSVGGPEQERLRQPLRQQLPDDGGQTAEEQASNQLRSGLTAPATGEVNELSAPPTGEANPLSAPATGEVNELSASPTGRPPASPALTTDRPRASAGLGAAAPGIVAPVGALTIDQSGTGRLQQVLEGVQVADVVGLALVIYTEAVPPANVIPPGGNTVDAPVAGQRTAAKPPVAGVRSSQGPMPVAAGLIRLSGAPGGERPVRAPRQPIEPDASARGARQPRSQ